MLVIKKYLLVHGTTADQCTEGVSLNILCVNFKLKTKWHRCHIAVQVNYKFWMENLQIRTRILMQGAAQMTLKNKTL